MTHKIFAVVLSVLGNLIVVICFGFSDSIRAAEPPHITLIGSDRITNECHAPFFDPGVKITDAPVSVAAGVAHSLALKADGSVVAWGLNYKGETNVPADLGRAIAIAAGAYYSIALKEDGSVVGWGSGPYGVTNIPSGAMHDVVSIAGGSYNALALRADGTVVIWGNDFPDVINIPENVTNVVAIAAGVQHCLALRRDGVVVGWGVNNVGQNDVPPSVTNVVAIADSGGHELALRADGTVVTWGLDDQFHQYRVPARATNVIAISAGGGISLALREDGTLVLWGRDDYGDVTVIPASATNVIGIASGGELGRHFCLALRADGSIVGWGVNDWGQTVSPPGLTDLNLDYTVTGNLNIEAVGTYTLNYTATNILGEVGTATRTVVITDTTPPSLDCPTNITAEWADTNGAPVFFTAQATDLCSGPVSVSFDPASGSTFPIGTSTVTCTATDDSGNSSQCKFTVTVEAGQAVKRNLLAELEDFKKLQSRKVIRLNRAIAQLNQSLKTNFWIDETHLQPAKGTKVFVAEARAVRHLSIWKKQKGEIDDARMQDWINRLVRVDRFLAFGQIEDARIVGATDKRFARALKHFQAGDEAAIKQKNVAAILRYACAWRLATHVIRDH